MRWKKPMVGDTRNPPTHDGFPNVSDSHWCRCFEEKP